jgi:hypothetical protein
VKRPPERKALLAAAILIVAAASVLLSRTATGDPERAREGSMVTLKLDEATR